MVCSGWEDAKLKVRFNMRKRSAETTLGIIAHHITERLLTSIHKLTTLRYFPYTVAYT